MDLADFISSEGEDTEEEQGRTPSSDVKKKASLSGFGRRLVAVASTVGGAIARSAEAAAEVRTFCCSRTASWLLVPVLAYQRACEQLLIVVALLSRCWPTQT